MRKRKAEANKFLTDSYKRIHADEYLSGIIFVRSRVNVPQTQVVWDK